MSEKVSTGEPQLLTSTRQERLEKPLNGHNILEADGVEEADFQEAIKTWRAATGGFSLAKQKQTHPTYLKLIGMGNGIVPSLLEELRAGRRYLFGALEAITQENPAVGARSHEAAVEAWLAWGEAKRLI